MNNYRTEVTRIINTQSVTKPKHVFRMKNILPVVIGAFEQTFSVVKHKLWLHNEYKDKS